MTNEAPSLPIFALLGKPNVGKSTFFNRFSGEQKAIVSNQPGITRDRKSTKVSTEKYRFELVDTGGVVRFEKDELAQKITEQSLTVLEYASGILFFTDYKSGWTQEDRDLLELLRKVSKPVWLVVNKADNSKKLDGLGEFYEAGIADVFPISSTQGSGIAELFSAMEKKIPAMKIPKDAELFSEEETEQSIHLSVFGRPNVGKSTLINQILGEERCIALDFPGTTRDPVDSRFRFEDTDFTLIDTAGLRRKSRIVEKIEGITASTSLQIIRRSDVVVILLDAHESIVDQDLKLISLILKKGKPLIIGINKSDLISDEKAFRESLREDIAAKTSFAFQSPVLFLSALKGEGVTALLKKAKELYKKVNYRIPTSDLNRILGEIMIGQKLPEKRGKRLKILFGNQLEGLPVAFLIRVNDSSLVNEPLKRYIQNQFCHYFRLEGIPLYFIWKGRESRYKKQKN